MKRKKLVSAVAAGMAILLILALLLSLIPATVFAASSSDIQEELNNLESQAQEIQRAKEELAQQQAANASDTRDVVSRKKDIDQEIKIIHDEIENLNAQIQNYNQLIVEKQKGAGRRPDPAGRAQPAVPGPHSHHGGERQDFLLVRALSGQQLHRSAGYHQQNLRDCSPMTRLCWQSWTGLPRKFRLLRQSWPRRSPTWTPKDCSGSEPGGVGREERRGKRHSGRADR